MPKTKNKNLTPRPPVVVIIGHVDHGKTTLLNALRSIEFTEGKPGGAITQHIGAFEVEHPSSPAGSSGQESKKITFLDTPGHEAFSAMRSRGAKIADIAILVVAADEGIKSQTKEAIEHIKKAEIPVIVALNKIDKPDANPMKARGELAKADIVVEDLGGKVPSVEVSAKTGKGISELLDLILLISEMEELKSDITKSPQGTIIESYLDSNRGPTATVILEEGILKTGDFIGTDSSSGKVRQLEDFKGARVEQVLPAMPAIVIGFEKAPAVGEIFHVFGSPEDAQKNIKPIQKEEPAITAADSNKKILHIILKTDVLGSLEACKGLLKQIVQETVAVDIIKCEVGEINENDVKLAKGADAIIVGFRVKVNPDAKNYADREKVRIKTFDIIYDLAQAIRLALQKLVEPEIVRVDIGKVKILAIFRTDKNRQIIGGKVASGTLKKGLQVEVQRNEETIGKGRIVSLQRNKKDIDEVTKGSECGMVYEGNVNAEVGDYLVAFVEERRKVML